MHIIFHILLSSLFLLVLSQASPIKPLELTIIFLSSILIDFDHILYYAKNNFKTFRADFKNKTPHLYIFHTLEFILLLIALSLFSEIFIFILIGCFFHISLDILIYLKKYKRKFFWLRYLSIISYFSMSH